MADYLLFTVLDIARVKIFFQSAFCRMNGVREYLKISGDSSLDHRHDNILHIRVKTATQFSNILLNSEWFISAPFAQIILISSCSERKRGIKALYILSSRFSVPISSATPSLQSFPLSANGPDTAFSQIPFGSG